MVLIEGVGAGREALRPYLAGLLWMELPPAQAWERGRARDGAEQRTFWDGWIPAERRHFAADPSRPFAHLLVRQSEEGYEVLPGPAGCTSLPGSSLTVTDHPQCGELVKIAGGQRAGVPQLRLTRGPYRSYVLNVRSIETARRREAPGCSPVIGGFVLP